MKRADFYLLNDSHKTYERSVCGLIDQLWTQGLTIHLYCETMEVAQQFDNDLWTFKDIRFIPHHLVTKERASNITVPICYIDCKSDSAQPIADAVLFNVAEEAPHFSEYYQKIVELVGVEESERIKSRVRYKHYQKLGYVINTQDYLNH